MKKNIGIIVLLCVVCMASVAQGENSYVMEAKDSCVMEELTKRLQFDHQVVWTRNKKQVLVLVDNLIEVRDLLDGTEAQRQQFWDLLGSVYVWLKHGGDYGQIYKYYAQLEVLTQKYQNDTELLSKTEILRLMMPPEKQEKRLKKWRRKYNNE